MTEEKPDIGSRIAALRGTPLAQLPWQSAIAGGLVSRFSTAHMSPEEIDAHLQALRNVGFDPKTHQSESLGPTIRLRDEEAAIMQRAHDDTASKLNSPSPA